MLVPSEGHIIYLTLYTMAAAPRRIGLVIPKKTPVAASLLSVAPPRPSIFDEGAERPAPPDDVHGAIRRAQEIRAAQAAAATEAAAASSDAAAAYDYDSWKGTVDEAAARDREARKAAQLRGAPPREARYITSLLAKAAERKRERDSIFDRMHAKELAAEEGAAGTSEKFVTPAYQAVLAERAAAEAEELKRAAREVHVGATGSMADFYTNLMTRNVSFGAAPPSATAAAAPVVVPSPAAAAALPVAAALAGVKRDRGVRDDLAPAPPAACAERAAPESERVSQVPQDAAATAAAARHLPRSAPVFVEPGGGPAESLLATGTAAAQSSHPQPTAAPARRIPVSQDAIAQARAAALARLEARKAAAAASNTG